MAASVRPLVCLASPTKGLGAALLQRRSDLNIKEVPDSPSPSPGVLDEIGKCDILISEPDIILEVLKSPGNLKWIYSTWAGVEKITKIIKKQPSAIVTRNTIGYGKVMGEYVIGQITARERQFYRLVEEQKEKNWLTPDVLDVRPFTSITLGVLGVGKVGSEVCRMCRSLGMTVWGLKRSPVLPENSLPYINQFRSYSELPELLSACDYICNILPETPQTMGLLNNDVLQHCQAKKSIFINIGRGTVVSEEALLKALRNGWLGGAVLDVFEKEPLPKESPLWSEPNVIITPHCSGLTNAIYAAECFVLNYERFIKGEELLGKCDFELGY